MLLKRFLAIGLFFSIAMSVPAMAQAGFKKVATKDEFMQITSGKKMTIYGISVYVTPAGEIKGRAYGRNVSGEWAWKDGYFCRDLYWGSRDFGPNCQEVRVDGNKIRFASDRGAGRSAVLTLRAH